MRAARRKRARTGAWFAGCDGLGEFCYWWGMAEMRRHAVEKRLEDAARVCARNGAQLTVLRRSVMALILAAEGPVTAYQLLDQLKAVRKSAVPPTVYRALEFLLENRLVHRIERLNAFIPCNEADHGHEAVQFLICGRCGTVAEMEDDGVSEALAKAAGARGFAARHAIVELDGICAACASVV